MTKKNRLCALRVKKKSRNKINFDCESQFSIKHKHISCVQNVTMHRRSRFVGVGACMCISGSINCCLQYSTMTHRDRIVTIVNESYIENELDVVRSHNYFDEFTISQRIVVVSLACLIRQFSMNHRRFT